MPARAINTNRRNDPYYRRAKVLGFRSRAAFKIMELDERFKLFRPGISVLDLGCSPGGWLQVISSGVGPSGTVIGIDLNQVNLPPAKNITFIQGDIREERTKQQLLAELGRKVDVVVSDMAPHLSGVRFQDQYNSYELAEQALKVCQLVLKGNGIFVVKLFPDEELEQFKRHLRNSFPRVNLHIPKATRKGSSEAYLVARGFMTPSQSGSA